MDANGQWILTPALPTTASTTGPSTAPDDALDRADRLLKGGEYQQLHDVVLDWLLRHPKAPNRPRAIMLMAKAYFNLDQRVEAFYECDELLDNYPDSRLFFPTLELQYTIANEYLAGYKNKLLGLPIIGMQDTAIEMLFRIQERAPGSPIAERSLSRTADFYYRTSEFDLAADAYGAFLRIYPRSPEARRARLRQAYSNFAQFRGPKYDATPLVDARTEFAEIQSRDPETARDEGVQQFIERIDEQLAAKMMVNANYYLRVNRPQSAAFILRGLAQRYPNSRDAQTAREMLSKMPAEILAAPPPPMSTGAVAQTQPAQGGRK